MSTLVNTTGQEDDPQVIKPQNTKTPSFKRTQIRTFTDHLQDNNMIGSLTIRGPSNPRFIELNRNELFTALVDLYSLHFQAKWDILKRMVHSHHRSVTNYEIRYLARVYVSHWFIDFYVSIREATRKLPLAHNSAHYTRELGTQSQVYDNFLTLVLNSMKPTRLNGWLDCSIFIPVINFHPLWSSPSGANYFNIKDFCLDPELFSALIKVMTDPNSDWQTSTYSNDVLGRPFWLFDWHGNQAFAWFPQDDNFNQDDQNLAYIIGVACTPLLAPRDEDTPQQYPSNETPAADEIFEYKRVEQQSFHSNYDKDIIEHHRLKLVWDVALSHEEQEAENKRVHAENDKILVAEYNKLAALQQPTSMLTDASDATEETITEEIPLTVSKEDLIAQAKTTAKFKTVRTTKPVNYIANMYKIVTYKYYCLVIMRSDIHTRTAAHKMLIFKDY
nr:coat protein [Alfalfa deltapartitivirus]